MILTRGERRALVFLCLAFLCGLLVLGARSLARRQPGIAVSGEASAASVPGDAGAAVNINSASLGELVSLPGIGEEYARRIIELRERLGRFESVEDLLEVEGIGTKRLEKIRPLLCVRESDDKPVKGK